jgi:hypothetical protein
MMRNGDAERAVVRVLDGRVLDGRVLESEGDPDQITPAE